MSVSLNLSVQDVQIRCRETLDRAQSCLDEILAVKGERTEANTLVPSNELGIAIGGGYSIISLHRNLHPDKDVRAEAENAEQEIQKFLTGMGLNRDLYDAFSSLDIKLLDAEAKRLVEKTLRDFRRAGVDQDEETRTKIQKLEEELVKIGQDFGRHQREDVRSIEIDPAELEGLPEDYRQAHPAGKNGKVVITTDYPDVFPFLQYAESDDVRRRLSFEFRNRGYPKNINILKEMLAKRHELAGLLGHPHWASYIVEDKMVKTPETVESFIEKVSAIAAERGKKEFSELLERRRKDDSDATTVEVWQSGYLASKIKEEQYSFDPQSVRPYFEFGRIKEGITALAGEIFGLQFKKVEDLTLWHDSVDVYDVLPDKGGAPVGRIYLDLHPRDGKFKHAAQAGLVGGIRGRQIPEGVLMCNFPDPSKQSPALMDAGQVNTFFHEFGHLMHHILAGQQKWIEFSGVSTEWDFVEAPSQLLESWMEEAPILQRFARHYQTGEPIPTALVERMNQADEFGRGLMYQRQMSLAKLSLSYYSEDPTGFDPTERMKEIWAKYSPIPHQEGTNFHCSFGHLHGYSAMYYTYAWSLVIAKDLLEPFRKNGLMDRGTAQVYRDKILAPGGSRDAADLVRDFLGRDYSFDAFGKWLAGGD